MNLHSRIGYYIDVHLHNNGKHVYNTQLIDVSFSLVMQWHDVQYSRGSGWGWMEIWPRFFLEIKVGSSRTSS